MCIYAHVPVGAHRGEKRLSKFLNWSYSQLWASSDKAASALNHQATSAVPFSFPTENMDLSGR